MNFTFCWFFSVSSPSLEKLKPGCLLASPLHHRLIHRYHTSPLYLFPPSFFFSLPPTPSLSLSLSPFQALAMAVAQDLVLSDPESDIITHESTSALHSSEHDGDDEVASIIRPSSPHSSPRPSLLASRLSSIVFSSRTRRRNKALGKERVMMNRLHRQLVALRSMVPPSARSSQHSVIADALKYKKALKNEIHQLQRALPFARQKVNVVRGEAGLQISLVCKKKSGLLIALMEAIESFGLVLSKVNVCCRDGIMIDALSTQGSTPHVDSLLKLALMTTIARFSSITSV